MSYLHSSWLCAQYLLNSERPTSTQMIALSFFNSRKPEAKSLFPTSRLGEALRVTFQVCRYCLNLTVQAQETHWNCDLSSDKARRRIEAVNPAK